MLDKIQIQNLNVILENVYKCITGEVVEKVDPTIFHHGTPYSNMLYILRDGLLSRDEKRRRGLLDDPRIVYSDAEDQVFLGRDIVDGVVLSANGTPINVGKNSSSYVTGNNQVDIIIDGNVPAEKRQGDGVFIDVNYDNEFLSKNPVILPESFKKLRIRMTAMINFVKGLDDNQIIQKKLNDNIRKTKTFLQSSTASNLSQDELFELAKPLFKEISFKLINIKSEEEFNAYCTEIGNRFIEIIKDSIKPGVKVFPDYIGRYVIVDYVKTENSIYGESLKKYNEVIASYNSLIDMAKYIKGSNIDIGIREVVDNQIVYDLNVEKLSTMNKM